ncbi:hypothetical protein [Tumebacillus permanentifrigoris]|uniref:Uncharacterized protein n=1 Tax=Tumebacillus permanentifrigoris TaxID=378543 RepID=A0A316DBB6_9BACL|nr:hypothetical protein [Tumebacillus permanentifrigoris]PWK14382.1 hypothetical protein C7459_105139 [Tumebacillus permanentifrigoris]
MELVCPLCNGLKDVRAMCRACGVRLEDGGMITDYVGPYSPYELTPQMKQEHGGLCTHLLYCSTCGEQTYLIAQSEYI